jgi:hypothetical protein
MKTVDHPAARRAGGCAGKSALRLRGRCALNSRLRTDLALAQAWGRQQFTDQATITRALDAFAVVQIDQLRAGSEALFRRESLSLQHELAADWLWLDIDLTPLPISNHEEGSSKGLSGEKSRYGRQLRAFLAFTPAQRRVHVEVDLLALLQGKLPHHAKRRPARRRPRPPDPASAQSCRRRSWPGRGSN